MVLTKHIDDIRGLDDAFMKLYEDLVHMELDKNPFLLTRNNVDEFINGEFEKMYNVKLSQRGNAHHFLYTFDTVEFQSEVDLTMFVLKWS